MPHGGNPARFLHARRIKLPPWGKLRGAYPLLIGSVSITAESSEQPWTCIRENEDGTGCVWQWNGADKFAMQLGDETAVYSLNPDQIVTADPQLYWKSTAPATVTAWYPVEETVDLSEQSSGLAYVLKAEVPDTTCGKSVALGFKHQLAKVRVTLKGSQAEKVTGVSLYTYPACTTDADHTTVTAFGTQEYIPMHEATYNGTKCWKANVVPSEVTAATSLVQLHIDEGSTVAVGVMGISEFEEGKVHYITL